MRTVRALTNCLLAGVLASACGGEPPPRPRTARASSEPQPESSEWLYATEGSKGGREGECKQVLEALRGEERCKQALCRRGERLAKDWLTSCKKRMRDDVHEVLQIQADLADRASQSPTACEREALDLLEGCSGRKDCEGDAQRWATRCAASDGTPLVVRAIELTVERSLSESHRVKLDGRSCADMDRGVGEALACTDQAACEEGVAQAEQYAARCGEAGAPLTPRAGLRLATLKVGAHQALAPVPVTSDPISPKDHPVALQDGTGAVLTVCGERPASLASYLELRKACADGVIEIARVFGRDGGSPTLRVGKLDAASDTAFLRRFPSLYVAGEREARDSARVSALLAALDRALALGVKAPAKRAPGATEAPDAVAALVRALDDLGTGLVTSELLKDALRSRDGSLEVVFAELGRRKKVALKDALGADKLLPPLRRAQLLPLADVDLNGVVTPGATSAGGAIDLAPLLPRSVAAYAEALESRFGVLYTRKLTAKGAAAVSAELDVRARACGEAEQSYDASERKLLACSFGVEECDAAAVEAAAKVLDEAAATASKSWSAARVAAAAYGKEGDDQARAVIDSARCLEPWW